MEAAFVDLFADFQVEEKEAKPAATADSNSSHRPEEGYTPLQPFQQVDGWFMNKNEPPPGFDETEMHHFRGNYLVSKGRLAEGLKDFHKIEELRTEKFAEDQIIRTILRENIYFEKVPCLLEAMRLRLHTHGEQMQYWSLLLDYARAATPSPLLLVQRLRLIILLCCSFDYSSFWLRFLELANEPSIKKGYKLLLTAHCRAVHLLRREAMQSKGFVRECLESKANLLENELLCGFPPDRILEATCKCCSDLIRTDRPPQHHNAEMTTGETPEPYKPPHLSRVELPKKSGEEEQRMVEEFVQEKFPWCFEDLPVELRQQLCLRTET